MNTTTTATAISARINAAIDNTIANLPDYFRKTVEQRLPGGAGSVLSGSYSSVEEVVSALRGAEWEPYSHPAVAPGCSAFVTRSLSGTLGVVDLASLPADAEVLLEDRKGVGRVSAVVRGGHGELQNFVVAILGEEDGVEVLYTFHPGAPVRPSQVSAEGLDGKVVAAGEALALGLETAKIA